MDITNFDNINYRPDCLYFRGDAPCNPHKIHGVHCDSCEYFAPQGDVVLIIKLGAVGDVIRTTPLLRRIGIEFPDSPVWWLTLTPEVLPKTTRVFTPSPLTFETLRAMNFAAVINLDKDIETCAIAASLSAKQKFGFTLLKGKPSPCDNNAKPKFIRGIFDDISKNNRESYPEEIFKICGWDFRGEEYILPFTPETESRNSLLPTYGKLIVGLNTGCGERWTSRLWNIERWEDLIRRIQNAGMTPLLLGGEQELLRNRELQSRTNAELPEPTSLPRFFGIMNRSDIVVTGVTMGLHIAIGLQKRVVLMNNIFNPNEFHLYGRGEIVQPDMECQCYYLPVCQNDSYRCMEHLSVDKVFMAIMRQKQQLDS